MDPGTAKPGWSMALPDDGSKENCIANAFVVVIVAVVAMSIKARTEVVKAAAAAILNMYAISAPELHIMIITKTYYYDIFANCRLQVILCQS